MLKYPEKDGITDDVVLPLPEYGRLLDALAQRPDEEGISIPVDCRISSQGQSLQANGSQTIITSLATNNLRRAEIVFQPTAGLATANYPSVSCFVNPANVDVQWRAGSMYFPAQPANSLARQWANTSSAYGQVVDSVKSGLMNYKMFSQYTSVAGNAFAVIPNAGGLVSDKAIPSVSSTASERNAYADAYVLAYCFDNLKGSEHLDYDGISVVGMSGSQLITQVQPLGAVGVDENITPTIILTRTRYVQLKNGALRIAGV